MRKADGVQLQGSKDDPIKISWRGRGQGVAISISSPRPFMFSCLVLDSLSLNVTYAVSQWRSHRYGIERQVLLSSPIPLWEDYGPFEMSGWLLSFCHRSAATARVVFERLLHLTNILLRQLHGSRWFASWRYSWDPSSLEVLLIRLFQPVTKPELQ